MLRRVAGFAALLLVMASVTGCGSGLASVEGGVTLDGTPVQGATVTFVPDSGSVSQVISGQTDASGKFVLGSGGKSGAPAGNYKVVVTKTEVIGGGGEMKPGDPKYLEAMKKGMPKMGPGAMMPGGASSS